MPYIRIIIKDEKIIDVKTFLCFLLKFKTCFMFFFIFYVLCFS